MQTAAGFEQIENLDGAPIKAWTRGVPVDDKAIAQLLRTASLPIVHGWVAEMRGAPRPAILPQGALVHGGVRTLRRTKVLNCGVETRALQGVIAKASSMDSERSRRRSATWMGGANGAVVVRRVLSPAAVSKQARAQQGRATKTGCRPFEEP
jgi:hypothetical protein